MGRKARPFIRRKWYVTEAGGKGLQKLCLISEGLKKAREKLKEFVDNLASERREARKAGLVESDTPFTVAQLAARFFVWKTNTKKNNTAEFHKKNLRRLVKWYGEREARKLKLSDGHEYLRRLREDKLANTTINHHIRSAKAVLNYAVEDGGIVKNPWRKVDLLPEGKRKRVVTDEEFQKLLTACNGAVAYRGMVSKEENTQLLRDILHILRYTAMRPGELRKLRWDHLHLDDDLIVIPAEEQKTGTTAKNPEDRVIPLLPEAKAIFLARKEKAGQQTLVFPSVVGKQWTDAQFSRRFSRLRERAGLDTADHNGEKLVPYSLRHSRLTEAGTKEGWSLYTLMKFAGHTTAQMTSRYVHPSANEMLRATLEGRQRRIAIEEQEKCSKQPNETDRRVTGDASD